MRCSRAAPRPADDEPEFISEIAELIQYKEVAYFLTSSWKTARLHKLRRQAKRAARLYAAAARKVDEHPTPHGYGDGFVECMCSRCDRAMRLTEEAETMAEEAFVALAAYRAWQRKLP